MKGLNYQELLKKYDLKATPQRVIFLNELEKNGHLSIEELEEKIKKIIPSVSTATIYKNINAMVEKGLLSEVKLPNSKNRYEITKDSHAHFICEKCSKVEDLYIDDECLKNNIDKNIVINDIDIVIKGICEECSKKEL
ncbi:Fur family transcriptional regulator [Nitrosophilus kaiyonis]|uniref:Fur family transcriptional regulator n=1 Tax=Nitrosophilus kaiyonis TaxID=2930200 RepID=UPI002490FFE0|nr:transcriptional repressor [Nitrosophilus kaiyonis]